MGDTIDLHAQIRDCENLLQKYFINEPDIPISLNDIPRHIDYVVAQYLVASHHTEWLTKNENDIIPFQIGGISEIVLETFVEDAKEFRGQNGNFRIYENLRNGTKHFYAKHV